MHKACASAGSVQGEKNAFIAHILSCNKACIHASAEAISVATALKQALSTATSSESVGTSSAMASSKNKRGHVPTLYSSAAKPSASEPSTKKIKQGNLNGHTFKGINMPFSQNETAARHIEPQSL